jgi:hypothetical protein
MEGEDVSGVPSDIKVRGPQGLPDAFPVLSGQVKHTYLSLAEDLTYLGLLPPILVSMSLQGPRRLEQGLPGG